MAIIRPFRGLRYDPSKAGDPAGVVAPPYDVISADMQEDLYGRSPHNIVRLILGRQYDGDGPSDNRYTRARKDLAAWIDQGVLAEDIRPALYVYEQTFQAAGAALVRRGVICALQLSPFGQGQVYPHEETFSAPKADRMHLIKEVRANLSPIFGLVPDDARVLVELLAQAKASVPDPVEVREDAGIVDRLYPVTDPEWIERIAQAMAPLPVFIADGHHRYETALGYRDERRAAEKHKGAYGTRSYDDIMMMCVPMSDPGLVVLPTHRLLRPTASTRIGGLPASAAPCFRVEEATAEALDKLACDSSPGPARFGLVLRKGGKMFRLTLASDEPMSGLLPARSPAYRQLDVAVLHALLLGKCLGMDEAKVARGEHITYVKDAREAIDRTLGPKGDHEAAFVMRPTRVEQVRQVAAAGEKMPHKSTYFYPKLLTGLVLRRIAN